MADRPPWSDQKAGRPIRAAVDQFMAERKAQGLSLAELARRTGISRGDLSRVENGRNPNPTIETLDRYAMALGRTILLIVADRDA